MHSSGIHRANTLLSIPFAMKPSLTLAGRSRFVLWPMAHSALLQELVVLGSSEPISLPSCLTGIAGQVVGGAIWVLRQDDHRCVLPGTGPSLHPSGGRLAGGSTRH